VYSADNPLHRVRLQRGISLSQLAARTLLSPRILDKIDAGRFAELPGGLYARSYIRAVASAIGLDPEDAVRELADRLPPAEDPFALSDAARPRDPVWRARLNEVVLSARARVVNTTADWTRGLDRQNLHQLSPVFRVKTILASASAPRALAALWRDSPKLCRLRCRFRQAAASASLAEALRAEAGRRRSAGRYQACDLARRSPEGPTRSLARTTRRILAAAIDALILLTFLGILIKVTAWTCGVHPQVLVEFDSGALAVVWGILVVFYFVMLGGIGGKTPGAFMSQVPATEQQTPLQLPTVLGRALFH
jgi:hypothetical protein